MIRLRQPTEQEIRHEFTTQCYEIDELLKQELISSCLISNNKIPYFISKTGTKYIDNHTILSDRLANIFTPIRNYIQLYKDGCLPLEEIEGPVKELKDNFFSVLEEICSGLESKETISIDLHSAPKIYRYMLNAAKRYITHEDVDKYLKFLSFLINKSNSRRKLKYELNNQDAKTLIELLRK